MIGLLLICWIMSSGCKPNFENRPLGASVATSWTPVPTVYCQPVYTTVKQQALISKTVRILICRRLINVCGSSTAMNNRVTVLIRPQLRNRSEEHTSELQSQSNLVCRLLLEKKT